MSLKINHSLYFSDLHERHCKPLDGLVEAERRRGALSENLKVFCDTEAIHLSLGMANTIVAMKESANRLGASLVGMGAGAGNCPFKVTVAVLNKMNAKHNSDKLQLMDLAHDIIRPLRNRPVQVDKETLSIGYTGVYSSFLLHYERAAEKYVLDTHDLLMKSGKRKMVDGQEDMIIDVALDLSKK